jgi:hypothetical protein
MQAQKLTEAEVELVQKRMRLESWTADERERYRKKRRLRQDLLGKWYADWDRRIGIHPSMLLERVKPLWPGTAPLPTEFAGQLRGDRSMHPLFLRAVLLALGTTPEELFGLRRDVSGSVAEVAAAVQALVQPKTGGEEDLDRDLAIAGAELLEEAAALVRLATRMTETGGVPTKLRLALLGRWQERLRGEQAALAEAASPRRTPGQVPARRLSQA